MPIYRFGSRYSRWDGTQQIGPLSADDLMRAMSDDLMQDGDVNRAMQRLFRWGFQRPDGEDVPGLQGLMQRLRDRRQEQLERYDLQSMLSDIADRIEQIVETERQGIAKRLDEARQGQPTEDGRDRQARRSSGGARSSAQKSEQAVNPVQVASPVSLAGAKPARPESRMRRRTPISRSCWRRWPSGDCSSSTRCRRIPPRPSGR